MIGARRFDRMFESVRTNYLSPLFQACCNPQLRDHRADSFRAHVAEWRWATGDMALAHAIKKPFVKEMHRSDPKWLKPGATPKYGNIKHGLNEQGAIIV